MKILICVKEVPDVKVPLILEAYSGELRESWTVPLMEPADRSAIEAALMIRNVTPETHITLIHLGQGEKVIRQGLALGCDQGLCIGEKGPLHAHTKALVFARVARILGFDLILTGCRSQDTGSGQVGVLLASELDVPYAGSVIACEAEGGRAILLRQLSEGYRERVESPLPMVAAMEALPEPARYTSLPEIDEAGEKEIESLDLAAIGLPERVIRDGEDALTFGPLLPPVAKLRYAEAPDSSLPAHLRIRKLIEGTVATREGKVVTGDGAADALFETLRSEGWLDHFMSRE